MNRARSLAVAGAFALCLTAGAGTLAAQQSEGEPSRPETDVDGLVEHLLSTLHGLIEAIPEYEMPEINEHGDIIIRRARPERRADEPPEPVETTEI